MQFLLFIERNGAEACAIFKIKIEEYTRGGGFRRKFNLHLIIMEHFQEI